MAKMANKMLCGFACPLDVEQIVRMLVGVK